MNKTNPSLKKRSIHSQRVADKTKKMKPAAVFCLLLFLCSGCWSSREINTLGISIAAGIDQTENGYLVSQQVLNPKAISTKIESNETPVVLFTQEGGNLYSAIRKITLESPRTIYNAHLKMIILGEDLAKDGLKDILDFYMRDHEFRTDFYFAVARGASAREILEILTPLEFMPGIKLFQSLEIAEFRSGLTKAVDIIDLTQQILADGQNPVLPGIEITSGKQNSDSLDALKSVTEEKRLQYTGLGVFKEDKLIGWLSGDETRGYNYILGNAENVVEYIQYNETDQMTFELFRLTSTITVSSRDEKLQILVKIKTDANIVGMEGDLDISKEENIAAAVQLLKNKLYSVCQSTVKKVQNDFCCDIFGFGEAVHRKEPRLWKKFKTYWNHTFSNLSVDFDITINFKHSEQISKPMFRKEE